MSRIAGVAGLQRERVVDPWGLVDKDDVWYLIAGTEHGPRTFRVDRDRRRPPHQSAPRTGPPVSTWMRLGATWSEVVEQKRSHTWASVKIAARYVPILRDQFGDALPRRAEGWQTTGCVVTLAAPTPLDIARHLAGWGAMVEVIEPETVREQLARIGAELIAQYA